MKRFAARCSCIRLPTFLLISILSILSFTVSARDLQPINAQASELPVKTNSAQHFSSNELASFNGHFDERLDIPTFLTANPGAVRQSGAAQLMSGDPSIVARGYLKSLTNSYKISTSEVDALPVRNTQRLPNGAAIVNFGHVVNGIEIFRERVGVLVNADGSLNSFGGYVSGASDIAKVSTQLLFRRDAQDAVATALQDFNFEGSVVRTALRSTNAHDDYQYFTLDGPADSGETLAQPARVKQVFFRTVYGLVPAWYLEIRVAEPTTGDDSYYAYVVSAKDGSLLFRQNLTQDAFAYRVWAETTAPYLPYPGPQGRNGEPHPTAMPDGYQTPYILPNLIALSNALPPTSVAANDPWLSSSATQTVGNNVDAYADLSPPDGLNGTDYRATITSPNVFDRTYDTSQNAQVSSNQVMASITQLFYVNNWLHDWYYDYGFDEASGNAQTDNFGRGGIGGDPIHAEVGNNPARNNSNMATPEDGASPRMQMYVFDGRETIEVDFTGGTNGSATTVGGADFGPRTFDVTGDIVYVNDGVSTIHDGCESPFTNSVSGKIALIDRGGCSFKLKALNAQTGGAIGVLIVNNISGPAPGIGDDASISTTITVPTLSIQQDDGLTVKSNLPTTARLLLSTGVEHDGAIDNMIVAHEWGHYISSRLANGLYTSNMGGGMGEGFGDFHALLMTVKGEDALVASNANFSGTYGMFAYSAPLLFSTQPYNEYYFGLRRYPYSTDLSKNPLTYKHIQTGVALPTTAPIAPNTLTDGTNNAEVHNTGEVWASMLWQCYASLLRDTPRLTFAQAQDRMKRYLVAGYKLMPVAPTFVEARDSILAVAYSQDVTDYQDCASGFASRGIGAGAISPDRYSADNDGVVESFSNGAAATWTSADLNASPGTTCDSDNSVDSLESGTVLLKLHNDGFKSMSATSITVSSPDSFVGLPQTAISIPALAPYATASVPIPVQIGNVSGIQTITVNYSAADPSLVNSPLAGQAHFRVNVDYIPSKTDDFENATLAWTPVLDTLTDVADQWSRLEVDATHHVAFGPDTGAPGLSMLVSPPLQVTGNFSVSFKHNFQFEVSDQNYDGGVVEISSDGGSTWKDVTSAGGTISPAYNGTIYTGSGNPLSGRAAFVGDSNAGLTSVGIDFGAAFTGQTVMIRFVVGTDAATGAPGWQVDDFSATGISNMPFTTVIADPGHCTIDRVFANGFELN